MSTKLTRQHHTSVIVTVNAVDIPLWKAHFIGKVTDPKNPVASKRFRKNLYETIGRNVKSARKNSKLTQEQLADGVKMTRTSITNIEKGKQKLLLHTLYELAFVLQVPAENLMPTNGAVFPKLNPKLDPALSKAEKAWIENEIAKV